MAPLVEIRADAEYEPPQFPVYLDLGPDETEFAPASFGHRLIDAGFIIDPGERDKPEAVNQRVVVQGAELLTHLPPSLGCGLMRPRPGCGE
ncbi:hypothetical protein ACH4PU_11765 [Streptomyces sp. NPDC021100]|uniref:hypothetical protein n=1 Tax=Streptomyces sp. NPDC021100 TaxID=3365114 RepID=UPI0037989953